MDDEVDRGQDQASGPFENIRQTYEADGSLSEQQMNAIADVAVGILRSILACFDENTCSIDEYDGDDGELVLDIRGGELAVLIGRHGVALDALQTVFTSMLVRRIGFHYPVTVDIEGYKDRHRRRIVSSAQRAAEQALTSFEEVSLPPMSSYDRRLVHLALKDNVRVTTRSSGMDDDRHVIVVPVRE